MPRPLGVQQRSSILNVDTAAFAKALRNILDGVQATNDWAGRTIGAQIVKRAKELVPVETGRLHRALSYVVYSQKDRPTIVWVGVDKEKGLTKIQEDKRLSLIRGGRHRQAARYHEPVDYDAFVEFGTSLMHPRPHWRPAIAEFMQIYPKLVAPGYRALVGTRGRPPKLFPYGEDFGFNFSDINAIRDHYDQVSATKRPMIKPPKRLNYAKRFGEDRGNQ